MEALRKKLEPKGHMLAVILISDDKFTARCARCGVAVEVPRDETKHEAFVKWFDIDCPRVSGLVQ